MTKKEKLQILLKEYSAQKSDVLREVVRSEIWETFGEMKATLITDMSGFTYITHHFGSVHYLSMIQIMEETAVHIINDHGGVVVKCEADNIFSLFDDPKDAIDAGIALNRSLVELNKTIEQQFHIAISCGIAYGEVLVLDDDIYGKSVIIASKLGEDIATSGEILVSKTCIEALNDADIFQKRAKTFLISKVETDCFYVEY